MRILQTLTLLFSFSLLVKAGPIFDTVSFGDLQDTVLEKLLKSKLVKSEVDQAMFARIGLNGAFTTTNKLQGLTYKLYFKWSNDELSVLTLRSEPVDASGYNGTLKSSWQAAINLLSAMHGKPTNSGDYPDVSILPDGGIMYSTAWQSKEGYIYLGIGKQEGKLNLSISLHKNKLRG